MSNQKLTEKSIAKLTAPDPSGKPTIFWDEDLKGFGVLVSGKTSTKTYVVQRRLPSGKTRRVTIDAVNVLTLEKARAEAEIALHGLRQGNDPRAPKPKSLTLQQALDNFLAARHDLRPKSVISYQRGVEANLAPWLGILIKDISPEMVERRHTAIAAEIGARWHTKQPKTAAKGDDDHKILRTGRSTANGTMRALRAIWNFAQDRDPSMGGLQNPVRRLRKSWFSEEARTRRLTSAQLPDFYKAVDGLSNLTARAFILLLLFTGLRRAEAASLRWKDIDLAARVIHLPARATKAGRALTLPMSDFVHSLLVAHRALGRDGDYIFASRGEAKPYLSSPEFAYRKIEAATGIYVSSHDLRRTFVSVAESLDISVFALKALVNHSAGGDVTAGYVVFSVERLRDPAQRVADRLKQMCGLMELSGETIAKFQK